jgi:hypothetical protein
MADFLTKDNTLRKRIQKNNNMFAEAGPTTEPALGPSKAEPAAPKIPDVPPPEEQSALSPNKPLLNGPSVIDPKKVAEADISRFRQVGEGVQQPTDLAGLQEMVTKRFENLDSQDKAWMQNQYNKLNQLNQVAAKRYQEDKDRMQWAEVAQMMTEALGQLGYAYSATKNGGMYAGPLEFKKTDWESKYNRLLNEYKMSLDANKDAVDGESRIEKASSEKRRAESDKQIQLAIQTYQDQIRAARQKVREAKKPNKEGEAAALRQQKLQQATKQKYAAIETELFKMDEGGQDTSKTLANINKLLKGNASIEELKANNEERGSEGFNLLGLQIFEQKPDKLKQYLDKLKNEEYQIVGLTTKQPSKNPGPGETKTETALAAKPEPKQTPPKPGMVLMKDKNTGEEAWVAEKDVEAAKLKGAVVK